MKSSDDYKKSEKNINKNTPNENLKEQIVNNALQFHRQGKIHNAAKYYQDFFDKGFKDHRVFSNYGVILKNLGKLQEAEFFTRKAIKLNPNYANAYSNLGWILKDGGKLQEAEVFTRKAIALNPNNAMTHSTLGGILKGLGQLEEAEKSYRKAIKLNPNYADSYFNLGIVLRHLGKLEDLISESKSIIQSKKFNNGDRLRAFLNIAIANLLLKNFTETFSYIKKITELTNQGAINIICHEKNRKHTSTFIQFITNLYPLLDKDESNLNIKKIPHFGESHCLCFAHQNLLISSQLKQIQPVLITGAKALHFANSEVNQWKDSLNEQIKNHKYSDMVLISFGEIDCRKNEGIIPYAISNNKDISEICSEIINGFLDYMEIILSVHYLKRYYFGIPAPCIDKKLLDELDIKNIETIKIYNLILKKEVLSRSSYFIDVYNLTSTIDGINNENHMCDKTHLSPKCLSTLFEKYVYSK